MLNFLENNKRTLTYAFAGIAILGICFQLYKVLTPKATPQKSIPFVRTTTVGLSENTGTNNYPGAVHGRYESRLAFQVGGKINARLVNLGDKVKAGQILMTLDPKDVQQSVEASNATLTAALSNQKLAETNAQRYRQLYAQGATSKAALDTYNTQLDAANAALRQAQAQAQVSSNQLGYTQLKSDTDGVVAAITGEVGMVTGAGTIMATVVQDGEYEVQINVPEKDLNQIKAGQKASITFWALDKTTAQGHIRDIASMADSLTKTYRVNVAIDSLPAQVKLGMTAKVTLNDSSKKGASFLLPASAIYKTGSQPQVWLVKDNRVQLTNITVANYSDNEVIVSQGLKSGDIVVTAGISKLVENTEVRLLEASDTSPAKQGSDKK